MKNGGGLEMNTDIKFYRDKDNRVMAILIPSEYKDYGSSFITDNEEYQQIAYMKHKKGHEITPHYHNKFTRNIDYTCETLVIRKGILEVRLFEEKVEIYRFVIKTGDILTLLSGGHGFLALDDIEMIEIKQGPFVGTLDKTRF